MKVIVRPRKGHLGITIHKPKVSFDGKPIPKGMFSDSDKDGYPNPVDCEPFNKNKQGALSWMIAKAKGKTHDEVEEERYTAKSQKYAEREAIREARGEARSEAKKERSKQETQRYEEKILKTQRQARLEKEQAPIREARFKQAKQRLELGRQRTSLIAQRQKSMGDMPSMMGGFGSSKAPMQPPSLMTEMPLGFGLSIPQQAKTKTIKRRKSRRKRK